MQETDRELNEKRRKLHEDAAEWYRANPRATQQPATLAERRVQALEIIATVLCTQYVKEACEPSMQIDPALLREAACDLLNRLRIGHAPQVYESDFYPPIDTDDVLDERTETVTSTQEYLARITDALEIMAAQR